MNIDDYQLIEKEEVSSFHFPLEDVLTSSDAKKERQASIDRAISLGNLEHQKVKIFFKDDKGFKVVDTTIWAVTDSVIVLKQNNVLPINRILKLEI